MKTQIASKTEPDKQKETQRVKANLAKEAKASKWKQT